MKTKAKLFFTHKRTGERGARRWFATVEASTGAASVKLTKADALSMLQVANEILKGGSK